MTNVVYLSSANILFRMLTNSYRSNFCNRTFAIVCCHRPIPIFCSKLVINSSPQVIPRRFQSNDDIVFNGEIPVKQIQFSYILSSGPGGQNVQKVATKVELRLHVESASWLSEDIKQKFREKHPLTKDGFFIVRSELTRSQALNQADAVNKLRQAITKAIQPEKVHIETEEEKEKRLRRELKRERRRIEDKRTRSQYKRNKSNQDCF